MTEFVEGEKIGNIYTRRSWNDNGCVWVEVDEVYNDCRIPSKRYLIDVLEFLKVVNGLRFKVVPKRKYEYLEIVE